MGIGKDNFLPAYLKFPRTTFLPDRKLRFLIPRKLQGFSVEIDTLGIVLRFYLLDNLRQVVSITKAFGTIFFILILMMAPAISYFLPGWNPQWAQIIPSNPIIQGLKDVISAKGNMMYTLFASAGFLVAGVLLFIITDKRFRKTLNL